MCADILISVHGNLKKQQLSILRQLLKVCLSSSLRNLEPGSPVVLISVILSKNGNNCFHSISELGKINSLNEFQLIRECLSGGLSLLIDTVNCRTHVGKVSESSANPPEL
jgi:hypothetical protein